MTRALLNEFARCQKSFVLSLLYHGLDNESLRQMGGALPNTEATYDARRDMICGTTVVADAIANAANVVQIDCSDGDIQGKLDSTWDAINSGEPAVIYDGALEGGDFIVPFSVLIVREDGLWDVFHQSTKTLDNELVLDGDSLEEMRIPTKKTLSDALSDAAPLMYVLSTYYPDNVARFAVLGADKQYVMPYPDPRTGEITIDPNDAIYWLELDYSDVDWSKYLGAEDPMAVVYEMQEELAMNPYWIPEAEMGSQCGASAFGYECPYNERCTRQMRGESPNHLKFHLPYHDYNRLHKLGYETMDDLLDLSYEFPTLEDFPKITKEDFLLYLDGEFDLEPIEKDDTYVTDKGKDAIAKDVMWVITKDGYQVGGAYEAISLSVDALRELRAYEDSLAEVEAEVKSFLS